MATPSLPPSSTASPSYRSALDALDRLVAYGLTKAEIVVLQQLGPDGVRKMLAMLELEGQSGVMTLLGLLEHTPEEHIGSYIASRNALMNEQSERDQQAWINPPTAPIDNVVYATPTLATSRSTPYLRPPLPPSLQRSTSTRSARSVSSKASSSTNVTHPSSHNRVEKKKPAVKPARKQLHCPDCKKDIKNGFDKHFREHLHDLVGLDELEFDISEAFGCGYCPAQGVLVEGGKVFHGVAELVQHVKDAHASTPQRLIWDISYSFNHVLSAQPYFRRRMIDMITANRREFHNHTVPSLSWAPDHRPLLRELQIMSGKLDRNPSFQDDGTIDNLLAQVYDAAAQNWQQPFAFSAPPVSPHGAANGPHWPSIPHHPRQKPTEDMFAGIGKAFPDTPTPKHHSFASDAISPSILSPSPLVAHAPPHIQQTFQDPQEVQRSEEQNLLFHAGPSVADVPLAPPMIAFPGFAQYSPPPLSQELSVQDICNELGINESDLYTS